MFEQQYQFNQQLIEETKRAHKEIARSLKLATLAVCIGGVAVLIKVIYIVSLLI